jgi:hypothetical protein
MEQKRDLYAPLRRPEDFQLTWPLLPGEQPPHLKNLPPACGGACEQGRQKCATPDACRLADDEDAGITEGMGAVVVPAVVAAVLAVAALVAFIGGKL